MEGLEQEQEAVPGVPEQQAGVAEALMLRAAAKSAAVTGVQIGRPP